MDEQIWLPVIRSSGSSTLGEAVLRLAALAESAHRRQISESYQAGGSAMLRADGPAPRDVVAAESGGRLHKEVDR